MNKITFRYNNIPDYPGYYVSRRGNVYTHKLKGSNKGTLGKWYRLKTHLNHGYPHIILWKNGKRRMFKVHRLVAMVYIPNPNNYPIVCHKDNDKSNPYYQNLYWGTILDNNLQCIHDGLVHRPKGKNHHFYGKFGENHPASRLPDKIRKDIIYKYLKGNISLLDLAHKYGISQGAISKTLKKYKNRENLS